ncbi:nucleoside triphosphate pyrophosphohydrolase [Pseudohongiella nitratireducens]|uniref:Nucleoside triphosphate pyrophosphohydrolase n=1 Tax=Pseudohongiella nitratireducens TaxID=1768907 RepID=A0A917GKE7_9GAMM|nr:nucleoside triphosphate pyrophosphohydrolase [Pseudohongiella nitratireducens]GGG49155.1 nucleoside triphosphate pyrophosphohydrolase [Pseudohongiella nitratireducens]
MTSAKSAQLEQLGQLLELMRCLRDPENGCAWDRKQTWQSLCRHTLEEVYEVVDAIEEEGPEKVCDELGDLLFQIVFYARIAEEEGTFDLGDIADKVTQKLLTRHPHLFPDGTLASFGSPSGLSAEQVELRWEEIKNAERQSQNAGNVSVLDDIPRAMPALDRAGKLQKRAASIGFDWADEKGVLKKVEEEWQELEEALASADQDAVTHELGDMLFTCVNLARHLRIDPESALRQANNRFESRFRLVEEQAKATDQALDELDESQLDAMWQRAKLQN